MPDLNAFLEVCEQAARAGGEAVQQWAGRFEVHKKGPADLVTQADFASQEAVRRVVLGAFPDHCLLGEESGPGEKPSDAAEKPSQYRWVVDPLDGTTNYVHGVPHYCVSLALEHEGRSLVGVVFDPVHGECYTAIEGRGAWLNGQPLRTSQVSTLSDALAAVGLPYNLKDDSPDLLMFLEMMKRCQAVRRTGSAALNLCYVAAGRFDMFWSYSTHIWDVAAGALIAREAGAVITSPRGDAFSLEEAHFLLAANAPLHAELLQVALQVTGNRRVAGL